MLMPLTVAAVTEYPAELSAGMSAFVMSDCTYVSLPEGDAGIVTVSTYLLVEARSYASSLTLSSPQNS